MCFLDKGAALRMVHLQTILRGFEAETVVHRQRVDSAR